jgi:hypothetical protein
MSKGRYYQQTFVQKALSFLNKLEVMEEGDVNRWLIHGPQNHQNRTNQSGHYNQNQNRFAGTDKESVVWDISVSEEIKIIIEADRMIAIIRPVMSQWETPDMTVDRRIRTRGGSVHERVWTRRPTRLISTGLLHAQPMRQRELSAIGWKLSQNGFEDRRYSHRRGEPRVHTRTQNHLGTW